jgi:WD40 repeat protein
VVDQEVGGFWTASPHKTIQFPTFSRLNELLPVWDVENKKMLYELSRHGDVIRCLTFSPDGSLLASGSWDRIVKIWSTNDGNLLQSLPHYDLKVESVAFSQDGQYLAAGSYYGYVRTWNTGDWTIFRTQQLQGWARSVDFSPDGQDLLIGLLNNGIEIYRVEDGSLKTKIKKECGGCCAYGIPSYTPDGNHVNGRGEICPS